MKAYIAFSVNEFTFVPNWIKTTFELHEHSLEAELHAFYESYANSVLSSQNTTVTCMWLTKCDKNSYNAKFHAISLKKNLGVPDMLSRYLSGVLDNYLICKCNQYFLTQSMKL